MFKNKLLNRFYYYFIILLRIIFAPLILLWPLLSIIVSFFLDLIDADFAHYTVTRNQYQLIDKSLDFWVYIFEMVYAWYNFPDYKWLLLALFLWRLIGMIVYLVTKKRKYFIIFGNFFENIFYVLYFKVVVIDIPVTFTIAFLIKVFTEWFIHVADLSVREDFFKSKRKWKR